MRHIATAVILVGIFAWGNIALAEMSSSNFIIRWDTISTGGSDTSSSATYRVRDTLGNAAIGDSESATYEMRAGYRQGVFDQVITFEIASQLSGTSQTANSLSGTTIGVATPGAFSVGDMVILIQDEGAGQISAVGRVAAIGGASITLDSLSHNGTVPTIDGTSDVVYELSGMTVDFGDLNSGLVKTSALALEVTADVDGGYSVQVLEDGNLRDGANDINDVVDGTVTAGVEEYGGRSSDTSLTGSTFDGLDTAFTSSFQDVVEVSGVQFEDRHFVTLKASIAGGTTDGTYSHDLTFIVSGNY